MYYTYALDLPLLVAIVVVIAPSATYSFHTLLAALFHVPLPLTDQPSRVID